MRKYLLRALFRGAMPFIAWCMIVVFGMILSVEFVPMLYYTFAAETWESLQRDALRRKWNAFANAANAVMESEKVGIWDVKKARECERLFVELTKDPNWRTK